MTGDGLLNIAANKQGQFEAVCRVVERADLIDDPRYAERQARLDHRIALKGELEDALAAKSAPEWQRLLNQAGVPAGCVLSVPGALDQPQVRERGMIASFRDVAGIRRDVRVVRTGFKINGQPPKVENPPPTLGQHTSEILRERGLDGAEIDRLHAEGAI